MKAEIGKLKQSANGFIIVVTQKQGKAWLHTVAYSLHGKQKLDRGYC